MKKYLFILILAAITAYSQNNEKKITALNNYADSVNQLIKNSGGLPGELMTATVNISRNERAIGLQNTKISYFYFQKEDSVYEINGVVNFLPQYIDPLAVMVEYNIAASQTIVVYYYIQNNDILYRFISSGGYGNTKTAYWISSQELLRYEERNSQVGNNHTIQEEKFSKEVYSNGILVIDQLKEHLKLYYNIFKVSEIDK